MHLSPVLAAGLFLALLAAAMEAKPAPPHLHKRSQGGGGNAAALGRELADLLEAAAAAAAAAGPGPGPGPPVAGGAAAGAARGGAGAKQEAKKGKGNAGATSRLMRDLRTDSKRTRGSWSRAGNAEHHFSAGGGGGGGGSRRRKGPGRNQACFGLKLDRVGTMSGLGC